MRMFVRSAVTGDFGAVQDAHALAESLLPLLRSCGAGGSMGWRAWPEVVTRTSSFFVRFTRDVAGIAPWGALPETASPALAPLAPDPDRQARPVGNSSTRADESCRPRQSYLGGDALDRKGEQL